MRLPAQKFADDGHASSRREGRVVMLLASRRNISALAFCAVSLLAAQLACAAYAADSAPAVSDSYSTSPTAEWLNPDSQVDLQWALRDDRIMLPDNAVQNDRRPLAIP